MRKIFLALIGFAWTFGIALSGPSSAQQSLRIGVSLSITGKQYSVQGGYGREGYLLCQKDVNAQGGVLRRSIEFVIYDDGSDEKTAARNYEKLITEDKVDAVLGPYGSAITEAVADVTEKHRKLMIAPMAATTSIWEKGRRYLIMMLAPVEGLSEGLLDLAARNGLKTVAVIKLDGLVANAAANGASELAKTKGLQLVFSETYPNGTTNFSGILSKVKATKPDVLMAASIRLEDLVAITRQARELDLNVSMLSSVPYGLLPDYYKQLGKDAEFVYSGSFWETSLPYPGNQEFVTVYEKEFKRTPAVQSAGAYAACRLLTETVQRIGSLDSDKLREASLPLKTKTVLGDFAVDERGYQTAHKAITIQWQNGQQVVVWPDDVTSGKPRFPSPPWSQR
jgi:branched-chain amino acid transport system substrate-binding protein